MGIEHRLTDNQTFWKCPDCGAVHSTDPDVPRNEEQECIECNEMSVPTANHAFWDEFWEYCKRLKDG